MITILMNNLRWLNARIPKRLKSKKGFGVLEFVLLAVIVVVLILAIGKLFGPQIMGVVNKVVGNISESQTQNWGTGPNVPAGGN